MLLLLRDGDADGAGDIQRESASADDKGFFRNMAAQAFRNRQGDGNIRIRHDHDKFLPAIAAGKVDAAHAGRNTAGKFLDHLVPHIMTMGIIDGFKEINIHDHHADRFVIQPRALQHSIEMIGHIAAVIKAGQAVCHR